MITVLEFVETARLYDGHRITTVLGKASGNSQAGCSATDYYVVERSIGSWHTKAGSNGKISIG